MSKVIKADASHAEAIARFNQAMALETEAKQLEWDHIFPGVKTLIENEPLGFYLVAVDSANTVVGCLGITYEWSDWRNGLFWWIQSVYVTPDYRGKGVFGSLYAEIKSLAKASDNACGIRLYVEKDNTSAYQTYINLGMIETEYRLMEEEF